MASADSATAAPAGEATAAQAPKRDSSLTSSSGSSSSESSSSEEAEPCADGAEPERGSEGEGGAASGASVPSGRRVIVIGAGASGLAAARNIRHAAEVVVVEARDRIGGRICTERLGDGTAVDLGAAWLHGRSKGNPLTQLAQLTKAELVVTDWEESETFEALGPADGPPEPSRREMTDEDWKPVQRLFRQSKKLFEREQARRIKQWPKVPDESLWDGLLKLKSEQFPGVLSLDERTRNMLFRLWAEDTEYDYAQSLSDMSFTWWNDDGCFKGANCLWKDGFCAVPELQAKGLDVRLGQVVVAVRSPAPNGNESNDDVNSAVEVVLASGETLRGAACVCSLPLGVLKAGRVAFDPPLPPAKAEALSRLGVAAMNKVVARFDRCFWHAEAPALARTVMCDARHAPKSLESPYIVNLKPVTGADALVFYFVARTASELETRSDDELAVHVVQLLESMYPPETVSRAKLLEVKVTRWLKDEFAMGSYSALPLGATPKDRAELARPEGAVFFAGEATHTEYPTTVHGAILSGRRAAKEVVAHLRATAPPRQR